MALPPDTGLFNYVGAYMNNETPLWLSALGPLPGPNNLQVSTLTVGYEGGIVLTDNGVAAPNTQYASVDFGRHTGAGTQLTQNVSNIVPGIVPNGEFLTVATNAGTAYDDLALRGLQVYGNQVTNPVANSGAAGYITQGTLPYSINIETAELQTNAFRGSIGVFSSIIVSSINGGDGVDADPLIVSSIMTSSITANDIKTSTIEATLGSFSTIAISSFVLPSSFIFGTLTGSTINVSSINAGTISSLVVSAGLGNFSSLNAPGFSGGGGGVTTSSVTTSSITTGLLSTTVGVIKEVFVSTMTFNATLSPNIDLGLGGIIGGLAGGFGANALSVGLGAASLGTGITALVLARQSGGPEPLVFQTVNGTSQLQFSTLGTLTTSRFTTNNASGQDPRTTPGVEQVSITNIQPGTYCMRTVSDHLNLPNASGSNNLGINAFSQWTPVFNGNAQVVGSRLSTVNVAFGGVLDLIDQTPGKVGVSLTVSDQQPKLILKSSTSNSPFIIDATYGNMFLNGLEANTAKAPIISASTIIGTAANINPQPITIIPGIVTSTIGVSTFTIGNVLFQNFTASTINASTITSGPIVTTTLSAPNGINAGASVFLSANIPNLATTAIIALSSINGSPYPPVIPPASAAPTASIIMYVGTTAPAGWVFCIGTAYSTTDPLYAPLFAIIGFQFIAGIPGPTFRVPDLRGITTFGASLQSYGNATTPFQITAIDFAALGISYAGVGVPNNTNANGLQALGMSAIPAGFDIVKGMVITNTVTGDIRTIIDIVNYKGGNFVNGFIGSYPNYPVLILNAALAITTGSFGQVFNVNPGGAGFYLGNQFPPVAGQTNMITQSPFQVATHTHTQLQGGLGSPDLVNGNVSGVPNTTGPATSGNNQNYNYAVPGGTSTLPAVMQVVPANLAVNYIIKL